MPPALAGQARVALFVLCASMPSCSANNALRGVLEAARALILRYLVKVPSSVLFYLVAALAIPIGVQVAGIVSLMRWHRLISTIAYFFQCFRSFPVFAITCDSPEAPCALLPSRWLDHGQQRRWAIFAILERFMIATILSVSTLTLFSPIRARFQLLIVPMAIVPSLFPLIQLSR